MNQKVNIYDSDCTVISKSNAIKSYYQHQYPSFYSGVRSSIHSPIISSFLSSFHGDKNYRMTFTRLCITHKEEKFHFPLKAIPVGSEDK